jgi:hypothetical protein
MEDLKNRFIAIGLTYIAFETIKHYPLIKIENYLTKLEEDYNG